MKKWIVLTLLLIGLAGCGAAQEPTQSTAASQVPQATTSVASVTPVHPSTPLPYVSSDKEVKFEIKGAYPEYGIYRDEETGFAVNAEGNLIKRAIGLQSFKARELTDEENSRFLKVVENATTVDFKKEFVAIEADTGTVFSFSTMSGLGWTNNFYKAKIVAGDKIIFNANKNNTFLVAEEEFAIEGERHDPEEKVEGHMEKYKRIYAVTLFPRKDVVKGMQYLWADEKYFDIDVSEILGE